MLLGPKSAPIVARHDWQFIRRMWPTIVKSKPSEKPSIVGLVSSITDTVHKYFPTIAIRLVIPGTALDAAYNLAGNRPVCDLDGFRAYIDGGEEYLRAKSEMRREAYQGTVDDLLDAVEAGNL